MSTTFEYDLRAMEEYQYTHADLQAAIDHAESELGVAMAPSDIHTNALVGRNDDAETIVVIAPRYWAARSAIEDHLLEIAREVAEERAWDSVAVGGV